MAVEKNDSLRGALDSVRVLDFTTVMAGPYATRLMADLGADVVKIEGVEGDQVRARPPLRDGYSSYFGHLNAGKRSLALDLKAPEAIEIVKSLAAKFDVVIENFRPGVMKRLGLDYSVLSKLNSRLIYCSISGYGQDGPRAQDPAYAPVIHAASGFDDVMRKYQGDTDKPATNGIFIADVLAGTHAFGAVQAALFQRERTNKGQYIDVSMLESMLGMLVFEIQAAQFEGNDTRPLHSPLKTLDGFIMIAPISARNFDQLCSAVEHPEWKTDPRFEAMAARNSNWKILLRALEEWTCQRTSEEVEKIMTRHGVPCSRYLPVSEVLKEPQLAMRHALTRIGDKAGSYLVSNPPFRMSDSRAEARNLVSTLGEHGPQLIGSELHMSDDQVSDLRKRKILF